MTYDGTDTTEVEPQTRVEAVLPFPHNQQQSHDQHVKSSSTIHHLPNQNDFQYCGATNDAALSSLVQQDEAHHQLQAFASDQQHQLLPQINAQALSFDQYANHAPQQYMGNSVQAPSTQNMGHMGVNPSNPAEAMDQTYINPYSTAGYLSQEPFAGNDPVDVMQYLEQNNQEQLQTQKAAEGVDGASGDNVDADFDKDWPMIEELITKEDQELQQLSMTQLLNEPTQRSATQLCKIALTAPSHPHVQQAFVQQQQHQTAGPSHQYDQPPRQLYTGNQNPTVVRASDQMTEQHALRPTFQQQQLQQNIPAPLQQQRFRYTSEPSHQVQRTQPHLPLNNDWILQTPPKYPYLGQNHQEDSIIKQLLSSPSPASTSYMPRFPGGQVEKTYPKMQPKVLKPYNMSGGPNAPLYYAATSNILHPKDARIYKDQILDDIKVLGFNETPKCVEQFDAYSILQTYYQFHVASASCPSLKILSKRAFFVPKEKTTVTYRIKLKKNRMDQHTGSKWQGCHIIKREQIKCETCNGAGFTLTTDGIWKCHPFCTEKKDARSSHCNTCHGNLEPSKLMCKACGGRRTFILLTLQWEQTSLKIFDSKYIGKKDVEEVKRRLMAYQSKLLINYSLDEKHDNWKVYGGVANYTVNYSPVMLQQIVYKATSRQQPQVVYLIGDKSQIMPGTGVPACAVAQS